MSTYPFDYSTRPHQRSHGPRGYVDYRHFKPWLRDEFRFACVYCLFRELWEPSGHQAFGVDHVEPRSRALPGLDCNYDNLVYSCNRCNSAKRDMTVIDPCATAFGRTVVVRADGSIHALSSAGERMIRLLRLDVASRRDFRRRMIQVAFEFRKRQDDPHVRRLFMEFMGFPADLPDLTRLEPPEGNAREFEVDRCHHSRRCAGTLPETY